MLRKIHFDSWLRWQLNNNRDAYLTSLESENNAWITGFRKNRNAFIHVTSISVNTPTYFRLSGVRGQPVRVTMLQTEMAGGNQVDLVQYCELIMTKLDNVAALATANLANEYDYNP